MTPARAEAIVILNTAFHEAGHAIVGLASGLSLLSASIAPDDRTRGAAIFVAGLRDRRSQLTDLRMTMAGDLTAALRGERDDETGIEQAHEIAVRRRGVWRPGAAPDRLLVISDEIEIKIASHELWPTVSAATRRHYLDREAAATRALLEYEWSAVHLAVRLLLMYETVPGDLIATAVGRLSNFHPDYEERIA